MGGRRVEYPSVGLWLEEFLEDDAGAHERALRMLGGGAKKELVERVDPCLEYMIIR